MSKLPFHPHNVFEKARIKLSLYYVLILMVISGSVSVLFYHRASEILENEYERVEQRLMFEWHIIQGLPPTSRAILQNDLKKAKQKAALNLVTINSLMLVAVGVLSYMLAGLTLEPIRKTLEEQRRFVGDAAHELKTPLTALKTSLEVNLMDETLPKATKTILQENLEDVTSLSLLTESMLQLAKVTDKQLKAEPLLLDKILKQCLRQLKPLAQAKNIKIDYQRQLKHQPLILGDTGSLIDLFNILLDNAIKYSPPKSTITLTLTQSKKQVEVRVTDEGCGIEASEIDRIFERFYQVDKSRHHSNQMGYGLGLAVAKNIVQKHKGSIKVASQPSKGSTFTVILPKIKVSSV